VYYTTAAWARAAGVGWESVANQLEKAAAWIVPRESIADRSGIYCKSIVKNREPALSSSSRYAPSTSSQYAPEPGSRSLFEVCSSDKPKSKPVDPGSRPESQRVTSCANRLVVTPKAYRDDGEQGQCLNDGDFGAPSPLAENSPATDVAILHCEEVYTNLWALPCFTTQLLFNFPSFLNYFRQFLYFFGFH
jgi:hypothetical protein